MLLNLFIKKLIRFTLLLPVALFALLSGCGVGTVLDPFVPNRIIAFGDAFMDVRTPRFTVNDEIPANVDPTSNYLTAATYAPAQFQNGTGGPLSPTNFYNYIFNSYFSVHGFITSSTKIPSYTPLLAGINVFAPAVFDSTTSVIDAPINPELTVIERMAADYGFGAVVPMSTIASHAVPSNSGVYSFAQANALVLSPNQSAGSIDTPQSYTANNGTVSYPAASTPALSIQAQIDLFLANNSISSSDMIVINAGSADIIYNALSSGGASGVTTAAQNFVTQIMRLHNAGAKHIVVFGPPNMGRSPFAYKYNLTNVLSNYSKTLSSANCIDFNCAVEFGLQQQIGTITQNPVLFVDISSQTSLITGTTNTGSANTYASFADPLYGVPIAIPGDPAFPDASAAAPANATDANYYCNSTNIPMATNTTYPNPFYINTPTISGSYPSFSIGGSACFANPVSPTSSNAVLNGYATLGANSTPYVYNYLSYAYADPINYTPSVHRMLADFILSKLSLASWR